MRGIWKKVVSGVLVGCIAFGTIATASAIQGLVTKELYYGDISVSLDGEKLALTNEGGGAVEPFAIDGTTYLPIRAISSALGLGVEWNQEGQEVKLTSPEEQSVSSCILVRPHADGAPEATVTVLEKDGDFWKETMSTDEAFVGRNGTTSNKQEGDGCTPRGIYTFGQAFGVADKFLHQLQAGPAGQAQVVVHPLRPGQRAVLPAAADHQRGLVPAPGGHRRRQARRAAAQHQNVMSHGHPPPFCGS